MKLRDILKNVNIIEFKRKLLQKEIKDIKIDHRLVEEGDLFIAMKGSSFNSNDYIAQAIANGAVAVLSDEVCSGDKIIKVADARSAYSLCCKHFFEDACDDLRIVAVTGTNGKTTTCHIISNILRSAGAKVGVIGTMGAKIGDEKEDVIDTGFTTPDPYQLHKLFKMMKEKGQEFVVMEASAHALALNKLDGIKFEAGVLTNITEDHLDFFDNMENYAKAKQRLFDSQQIKLGIICDKDGYCRKILNSSLVPIVVYGDNKDCDVYYKNLTKDFSGSQFECCYMGQDINLKLPLVGKYNVENALAAITVARVIGIPFEMIKLGLSCLTPVEGRFNVIKMGSVNVIIDFAHTPDGLENVLCSARELTEGKLVCIFGCGGNRDKLKRPIMGKIASELADEVILTSDNPRFEQPLDIINDILQGTDRKCFIIPDRQQAIEYALSTFTDDSTIVIAGKGGEKYQEIQGEKKLYNDFDAVYSFFRKNITAVENIAEDGENEDD